MIIGVLAVACRKKELMPEPEGEKVPHQELTITLMELLEQSNNQLFKQAWNKSHMNSILDQNGPKAAYTLLAPDDAAMKAAGWDESRINAATPEELDTLLMLHTLGNKVNVSAMAAQVGNVSWTSLLSTNTFKEQLNDQGSAVTREYPYQFRQYLGLSSDSALLINGKNAGKAKPQEAKDGLLWPVNRVLEQPRKTIMEALKEDGRFSLYLEALRLNDSLYKTIEGFDEYNSMIYWIQPYLDVMIAEMDWSCNCAQIRRGPVERTSIFAPTDEAFQKAGLFTAADIRKLASRTRPVYADYTLHGRIVMDSLLSMHMWGKQGQMIVLDVPPVFYTNDLTQEKLEHHYSQSGNGYVNGGIAVPLVFSKDASGRVQVQYKGSSYEKATVTTGDIETIQGPVHVVDRLLVPKNFVF